MSLIKVFKRTRQANGATGEFQQFYSFPATIPGFTVCVPVVVPVKVASGKNGADLEIVACCKHCPLEISTKVKFPKSRLAALDWCYPDADSEFSRFLSERFDSVCDDCAKELHKATCVPHGVNSQYNHLLTEHSDTIFCDVCLTTLQNLRL
ncbi:ORF1 [Physalis rugose mosaic virus]|uniref:ORF1 n=1 Tax=Physalis rugose mosaic virus TaxID=2607629 RepID=A0A5C1IS91_9VIRU|nr:ORF1 [Physalis rugose mosaic virus]QEM20963.1 ORF1 [Physalis rugose mosaic virus]